MLLLPVSFVVESAFKSKCRAKFVYWFACFIDIIRNANVAMLGGRNCVFQTCGFSVFIVQAGDSRSVVISAQYKSKS